MIFHEKEAVAAPRDVSSVRAEAWYVDDDIRLQPVTWHVCDFDLPILVELSGDDADRRLNSMCSRSDPAEVSESGDYANGPVAAHPQIGNIIEINYACNA